VIAIPIDGSPIERLKTLMTILRDRHEGCPWDVEQTFETLSSYTIEEAYEVDHAIKQADYEALKEELGDLLLQIIFHAEIARESGLFDFDMISEHLFAKLIRRHPHVFLNSVVSQTSVDQAQLWEQLKEEERANRAGLKDSAVSELSDIPIAQPALSRTSKLQKRLRFSQDPKALCDRAWENLKNTDSKQLQEEAIGELLFSIVALSRDLGFDAEELLRKRNMAFERNHMNSHA